MASGIEAMRRTIREKEPPRPSTRLATLKGNQLTTTAKRRASEPPRLIHLVRGDLDCIVMKCLEKDRQRRYETANGLAADLNRHLNSEPVVARPPSVGYRFQKLVSRNKLAFASAALVFMTLAAGVAVSTWQSYRATQNGRRAELAALRADRINAFLLEMLASASPEKIQGPGLKVSEVLEAAGGRLDHGEFANYPSVEAALRSTIGNSYRALELRSKAVPQLRRALALQEQLKGTNDPTVLVALNDLAGALDPSTQARPVTERAVNLGYRLYPGDHLEKCRALELRARGEHAIGSWGDCQQHRLASIAARRRLA